jgi:Iron-sulfur cluster-binding domain/Radical SAM superfamily
VKVIATLNANLAQTPIGTRSRLADELGGATVLARTVERVSQIPSVSGVYVFCPADQLSRCSAILTGTGATTCQHSAGPPPWSNLVRAARKWSLDGWRGGIGGATSFDEYTDVRLIAGLLETTDADAVLSIPPGAVLFDPALGEKIIDHRREIGDEAKMSFIQGPPGLTAVLLDADVIKELADKSLPIGAIFGYKPESPQKDMIFEPCCCPTSADVRFATGRLVADSDRAVARIQRMLKSDPDPDRDPNINLSAEAIGRRLIEEDERGREPFPCEVEIELTADDPYPSNVLRPRWPRVSGRGRGRGPMSVDCIRKIAAELSARDDVLCVLGGFGDPLRHSQLPAILEALRPTEPSGSCGGVFGLAVRTSAVDLTTDVIDLLIDHRVDILNVTLDAWTSETYQAMQSPDGEVAASLEAVRESLDRLAATKADRQSVSPLVVPEFCKSRDNIHEMDEFFDGWMVRLGIASITGFNHFGGRLPNLSVINMAPAARTPCRRVRSRAFILADGRVTLCDQDFEGKYTVGSIGQASLADIWAGDELSRARDAHVSGSVDLPAICGSCNEWHRP